MLDKNIILTYPIDVANLEFFMPHRFPMRWIDEVVRLEGDEIGYTKTIISRDRLMCEEGLVNESFIIELMGQAYGYMKAIRGVKENLKLNIAYLAAIDKFEMCSGISIKEGDTVNIRVETLNDFAPLYVITAKAFNDNNEQIANANLKCFAEYEIMRDGNE